VQPTVQAVCLAFVVVSATSTIAGAFWRRAVRGRHRCVALTLLAGVAGAPLGQAADAWVEVRSPSFTVVSDGSENDARRVLLQFERVRALLQEVWAGARVDTARPVTILAARDEGGLRSLLPASWEKKGAFRPAGVFLRTPDRNWVALRMDVARFRESDKTWDNPYLVIFHEYVHLVLHLNFESLPVWLNEGLAEFWASTIIEGDRVYEGRHVPYHLETLRQRTPLSLADLFAVTEGSPAYSEENRATLFYAECWALVHYLALGSDARRGQMDRYVALLQAGRPAGDAAREAFGDLEALDRELQAYVRRPVFSYRRRMVRLEVKENPGAVRRLSEAERLALHAGFHVATGRAAEARDLAGRALGLDPGLATAHEALGLLAWREGRSDEAREVLAKATSLPGASEFAHYLYGHLLWESLTGAEGRERVEASFTRAVELNPSFAAAYASLAQVMADRGAPLADTLPLAVRAARLEPGEIEHTLIALRLAARGGEWRESRARAEALLARAEGEKRRKVEAFLRELPTTTDPEDPESAKAVRLFEGACAGGDDDACVRLASMLRPGKGVAKDGRRAETLLASACDRGSARACGELGVMLAEGGQGVPRDAARARALLKKACAGGYTQACARVDGS
jgi:TPR repeat protein